MYTTSGWFNESIDLIPSEKLFVLNICIEDLTAYENDAEYKKMAFLLDAACPGKYIAIFTGNFLYNGKKEYYDNLYNRIIFCLKTDWDTYKHTVSLHEQAIYKKFRKIMPKHKIFYQKK